MNRLAPALVAAWYGLLTLALAWPAPLRLGEAALGSPLGDGLKHLWTLWWMRTAVWREGALPFHTGLVNHPYGMDLYPIEPLNGLVAVLLPGVPLVLLANLLVLANLWALGLAGHLLGRELGGSPWAGLAAGTLLLGSSVAAFTVHVGVGELQHLFWLPLGMTALLRLARTDGARPVLVLAACLAGATLSGFYIGLFLALAAAAWVLLAAPLGPRPGALLRRALAAAAAGLLAVLPFAVAFATSYEHGGAAAGWLPQVPVEAPGSRLELWELLSPGRTPLSDDVATYGGGRYVGFACLVPVLLGAWRHGRRAVPWLGVGLVGVVLSLGTRYTWGGVERLAVDLPFAWLNRLLALVAEPVNFPARFLALTALAVAALGALGLRGLTGHRTLAWLAAPLAAIEIALFQLLPRPWATFQPQPLPELHALAEQARALPADHPGAVLDLGLVWQPDGLSRRLALSAQLAHQRPIQSIPIERVEYFAREGQHFVDALHLAQALRPWYERRSPGGGAGRTAEVEGDLAILRSYGFEWVLVVERTDGRRVLPGIAPVLDELLGPPVVRTDRAGAWRVPETEVSPQRLGELRALHDARRRALAAQDDDTIPIERPEHAVPRGPPLQEQPPEQPPDQPPD